MRMFIFLGGKGETCYIIPSQQLRRMEMFEAWHLSMSLGRGKHEGVTSDDKRHASCSGWFPWLQGRSLSAPVCCVFIPGEAIWPLVSPFSLKKQLTH